MARSSRTASSLSQVWTMMEDGQNSLEATSLWSLVRRLANLFLAWVTIGRSGGKRLGEDQAQRSRW